MIWNLGFGISEMATVVDLKSQIKNREDQIAAIEAEIAEYQKQIDAKTSEAGSLKNQISSLIAQIGKLNAEIRLTQGKIYASELNLEKLDIEINKKNDEIEGKKASLAEIIRSINEADNESLIEILLKNRELSDFFSDIKNIENLDRAVQKDLGELKGLKQDLETKESEESSVKKQLTGFALELSDRKAIEVFSKKKKDQLLFDTKNKEAEYQRIVREREIERAQILEDVRKIEDQLRLLIDPTSLPASRPGVLGWPVANPKITQNFGKTDFAKNTDVYNQNTHNGIDLRASIGTEVMAAESGVVKGTGNSDVACPGGSYGKWILIEHPNHLSTLYAHLSVIKVSTSQEVGRGILIAYSGDTGYTTGPHLHFTVYDARTVQMKSSRVCGLLPYGGYLDPILYL
ncbi:hypothetical protein A3I27_00550 [Candidatus Giovannonibacteria bacterium RIFCSPLOWO2_02_FULL_43_11b]|uniref:M23ase beta-sheet core domain-containing protein n=1 Tax=Candidatus Giovannonibacteria bacterium RIFCSPHIGHO2_12_FULL_43_15 TaxID=1798341 RepID=A0A1F5WNL1_9BACT|nr:MAG: hypothetical protein A2739_01015 [Candidatus Giovannonibacteria bacterium RIFCSPHIGHO2_01_FULL_43_100]OGF66417.1 MAG: hypothetical protein A3B97_02735 [Candidatus Giovannonibacteria bacterium RIFCSPHIGHO2_02_FULL_43_32]OGF77292.1 MAG: hypothetical protein A3F23_04040 [Candidatus Giovannonibacteria bacterium RIFCSPHIGHO2_12_FULL_43_15]OGF79140.1 MAG: hypothetical protein A3A15_01690 [Candidatus Giovannonibacteria bacterium RIFCSPLOWO2_01_FULL_43_60]OGF90145.1 MAG: hypothetical protein A3